MKLIFITFFKLKYVTVLIKLGIKNKLDVVDTFLTFFSK